MNQSHTIARELMKEAAEKLHAVILVDSGYSSGLLKCTISEVAGKMCMIAVDVTIAEEHFNISVEDHMGTIKGSLRLSIYEDGSIDKIYEYLRALVEDYIA